MCSIQYIKQPFFRRCDLLSAPWINFSHLFIGFMHPFPLYFLKAFKHVDFIVISFKFGTQSRDPLGGVSFALIHFCIFCSIIVAHLTCVSLLLIDDTHIVGPILDVLLDFLQL
jgi:hypothetical protein